MLKVQEIFIVTSFRTGNSAYFFLTSRHFLVVSHSTVLDDTSGGGGSVFLAIVRCDGGESVLQYVGHVRT